MRIVMVACLLGLSGCATITSGSSHDVKIAVEPSNALVVVKDHKGPVVYSGRAGTIALKRGKDYSVTVSRRGYEDTVVEIPSGLNGETFVNILFVIPVLIGLGIGIDAASGGLWSMKNDDIHVTLAEKEVPAVVAPPVATAAPITSACRLAVADAPAYATRWAETHPDDKPRITGPSVDEFMATCRELPEEAQRCLVLEYAEKHNDACVISFDGLPPKYRTSVALLFSTP